LPEIVRFRDRGNVGSYNARGMKALFASLNSAFSAMATRDHHGTASNIFVVWDPAVVDPEDYAEMVAAIGDLARASGGLGVSRQYGQQLGVLAMDGELV
jgi:hypothetical protein